MTFMPIVGRELRVAARRRNAFRTRLAAAVAAIALGGWTLWLGADWQSASGMGRELFRALTACAFVFCLGAGPLFTADTLSAERREGTLGLLFLTDLHGYDIVFGKLAGAAVPAVFSLLAILPVLALPLLLGGVSLMQFGGMALALGNTLFLSLALGMVVSAFCREARSALALTFFLLFLLAFCAAVANGNVPRGSVGDWALTALSPTPAAILAAQAQFSFSDVRFLLALVGTHALAWVALLWASRAVSRGFLERPATGWLRRWQARWHAWNFGSRAGRREFRRRMLDQNPILWLASRNRMKPLLLNWLIGIALGVWLLGGGFLGRDWWSWSMTAAAAIFLQTPFKWLMASEAVHRWAEDRTTGALELLLTTPLDVPEILAGQMQAMRRMFAKPVMIVLLMEFLALGIGAVLGGNDTSMGGAALVTMLVFVADLLTLCWVGSWLGLVRRKPNQAFTGAVLRVMILPWLVFLALLTFTGAPTELGWIWLFWLFVCGTMDVYFLLKAREELGQRFRQLAAEPFRPAATTPAG